MKDHFYNYCTLYKTFTQLDYLKYVTWCDTAAKPHTLFSCCPGKFGAVWKNDKQAWVCIDCGESQSNDPNYLGNSVGRPMTPDWIDDTIAAPTGKCTCGSEKVYGSSSGHSSWCDKK